jgi:hypothetical protein
LEDSGTSSNNSPDEGPDPNGSNSSSPGCTSNTECGSCQVCGPATDAGPRACIPAPENTPCSTDNNSCTLDRCEGAPLHCVHRPLESCESTCDEKPLLAANAVASSSLGGNQAWLAIDDNTSSRWESLQPVNPPNTSIVSPPDPSWIYVDLGFDVQLSRVILNWELASAKTYLLQVAPDGTCAGNGAGCLGTDTPWTTVHTSPTYTVEDRRTDDIAISGTGRYVRMLGLTRTTGYGYSIFDFKAIGTTADCSCVSHSLHLASAAASSTESVSYTASEAIDDITGDSTNRWSSSADGTTVPQWLYVDLGSNRYIDRAEIDFVTTNAWSKDYTLSVAPDGATDLNTDAPWTTIYTRTDVQGTDPRNHELSAASSPALTPSIGRYLRFQSTLHNLSGVSLYELRAFGNNATFDAEECACRTQTLVRNAASASSVSGTNSATNAIDGIAGTRWESSHGVDPQWLYVDLGSDMGIDKVILDWESASARNYTISVAPDGICVGNGAGCLGTDIPWATVYTSPTIPLTTNHRIDTITNLPGVGRYVRMKGVERNTGYGYSLWNFVVEGTTRIDCDTADAGADAGAGDAGIDAGDSEPE